MVTINPDKVCYILIKAREFDEKTAPGDDDPGSNSSDDKSVEILEDREGDPTLEELAGAIDALNEDEGLELIALAWIGRGDFEPEDWDEALEAAREVPEKRIANYLVQMPLLGDYLEEGLAKFDLHCTEFEMNRL
jgi:Protein of unknown function (DUF3775)